MTRVYTNFGTRESARRLRVEPTTAIGGAIVQTNVQKALEGLDSRFGSGGAPLVTGTSRAFTTADSGILVRRSNGGALMTDTVPGPGTGVIPQNNELRIRNYDTVALHVLTVAGGGATIDGASFIITGPMQDYVIISDGTNYFTRQRAGRIKLGGVSNFYVTPGGSNSNHGLSVSSPWATTQYAWNYLYANVDVAGLTANVNLAAGSNSSVICEGKLVGSGAANPLHWRGSGSGSCFIDGGGNLAVKAYNGAAIDVSGISFFGLAGLASHNASFIGVGSDILFNTCTFAQMFSIYSGQIEVLDNYSIGGSSPWHSYTDSGGTIVCQSKTITLVASPIFSLGMLGAGGGKCEFISITMAGSAIGAGSKKYDAFKNGVVDTGGTWTIPGSVAGTTSSGGQFA